MRKARFKNILYWSVIFFFKLFSPFLIILKRGVTWFSDTNFDTVNFAKSTDDGKTWTQTKITTVGANQYPDIAVNGAGVGVIVWQYRAVGTY
jgi:hypothetical protein